MGMIQDSIEELHGLLIYEINGEKFCSDIKEISTILKPSEANLKLRSAIESYVLFDEFEYKLINIHKMLKFNSPKVMKCSKLILFEVFGKRFGFIVDKIIELVTTEKLFVEKSLDLIPHSDKNFISSILKFQNRIIYMIDFEKITKELEKLSGLLQPVHN